jgi:hypothetical protein
MLFMGFLWLVAVLVDLNFTTKALSAYVIFGEGIVPIKGFSFRH